jgi:hypothetical protein
MLAKRPLNPAVWPAPTGAKKKRSLHEGGEREQTGYDPGQHLVRARAVRFGPAGA